MARERIDILSVGQSEFRPNRKNPTDPTRVHGTVWELSDLFTGTGARQHRGLSITGARTSGYVMGGDAHDMGISYDYNNYAVNTPAGSYARGLSLSLANRGSGTTSGLQGAFISTRQRGDGGSIVDQRGIAVDVVHDVGGAVATGREEGVRVEFSMHAVGPTQATNRTTGNAAFVAHQRTDGVYANLPDAYAVSNAGTSGCKGFRYGLDFYDSRAATCDTAEIRMQTADAGGLPCIIASGTAANDGAIVAEIGDDTLYADGSLFISVVDGTGTLWQKRNDTWTSI
jgi:hypothetical protein